MKTSIILSLLFVLYAVTEGIHAQNVFPTTGSTGIGTSTPNSSALLDMESTTQGLLIPRLTLAQKTAVATPATGLIVYQTDNTPGFYYYTGTAWALLSPLSANTTLSNLSATTAMNSNILPGSNSTYNLGSSTLKWANAYLAGAMQVGSGPATPTAGMIEWAGSDFQGYNGTAWVSLTKGSGAANTTLSNLSATTAMNSNILPSSNSTYNLGSSTLKWANAYLAGAMQVGSGPATPTAGMIEWAGSDFQGYNGTAWVSLTKGSGAANTTLSNLSATTAMNSNILPSSNSTYNLGSSTLKWANAYLAGAMQVGSGPATPTAGMIEWAGSDFQGYNGTAWVSLTKGSGAANTTLSNLSATTAMNSNILPSSNSTYNLGSSTLKWANAYLAGAMQVGSGPATPTAGMIEWAGSDFQGYNGTTWVSLTKGSGGANTTLSNLAATTSVNSTLLPGSTGNYNMGSSTLQWANAYLSGAVQVGPTLATPTTGMIEWSGSDFQGYNGTAWVSLTKGTGSGNSLWASTAGGLNIYNTNADNVIMNPVTISPYPGNNKLQVGNPQDFSSPTFSGNDFAIYNNDGINGMSFFNSGTSSIWYSTANFSLMPTGGNGYLGIGTTTPQTQLEVLTPDATWGTIHTNGTVRFGTYVGSSGGWVATQTNNPLYFATSLGNTNDYAQMTLLTNGNVGIGTLSPAYSLSVNGTIQAKEVIVQTGWSDYVFEKNYNLRPIEEVQQYVEANKHLPDVPSAEEVETNGVKVAQMDSIMIKKIEELTLYLLQQNKQITEQNLQITQMQQQIAELKKQDSNIKNSQ